MIIDLQTISRSPRHFDLVFHDDWWRRGKGAVQVHGLEGPLNVTLDVVRDGERFLISGHVAGELRLACDRCLDTYCYEIHRRFRVALSPPELQETFQSETELEMEDMAVEFIENSNVDLDDVIREQIYLSLPMKTLCSEACAGLCPGCGINLNRETCTCNGSSGHPAFQKLKSLRIG